MSRTRKAPLWGYDENDEIWLLNEPTATRHHRAAPRRTRKTRKRARRARTNPALALYGSNPTGGEMARARDSRGRFLKRRRGKGRKHTRRVVYRRRSHARRNPPAHHRPRRHRSHYRRRHARRNPSVRGAFSGMRRLIPGPKRIVSGMAGAVATRVIPGYAARWFPQIPTAGIAGMVVRAASAIGAGWLAGRFFGAQVGEDMAFGGLITVADDLGQAYLYPAIGLPMGAYLDPSLHAYLDPGMGQYLAPGSALPMLSQSLDVDELGQEIDDTADRLNVANRFGLSS